MRSQNPDLNLPQEFVEQIEQVTEYQIDELIRRVLRRFGALCPDREGVFLSLSVDPNGRREEVEEITRAILSAKMP